MTNQETKIYETQLNLSNALKAFNHIDIYTELEKGGMEEQNTPTINVQDIQIEHEDYPDMDFYFTGEITYESDSHMEQDWDDNNGEIDLPVIDKVHDNILGYDGILTAWLAGENRSLAVEMY